MAVVTGTILSSGEEVQITIPTVRIPELPEVGAPIEGTDKIAVYDESENSTRYQTLDSLRDYIATGGASVGVVPTVQGSDVEIIADAFNISGENRVLEPALQNKNYTLERVGYGQLLTSQFLILPSGGFELIDDKVRVGDVFFAHVFTPGVASPGNGVASASSFLTGIALINDDIVLNTAHYNKLLHCSSATKNIEILLSDIAATPANTIFPFETTLSNDYYTKIQSQGGQLIYFDGSAVTEIWLGANEFLWVMRGVDGWYVIKASESISQVGRPIFDVRPRNGYVHAIGQEVPRASYPRIWKMLEERTDLMVTENDWQTLKYDTGTFDQPEDFYYMRSKYSNGNGTTTFRFPDLQGLSFRALKNYPGSDTQRSPNSPGTGQGDMIRSHSHLTNLPGKTSGDNGFTKNDGLTNPENYRSQAVGGAETRMKNGGFLALIKV